MLKQHLIEVTSEPERPKMKGPREEKRAFWRKVVVEWEMSGQSASFFCREHGFPLPQFNYWKKRLRSAAKAPTEPKGFVQVSGRSSAKTIRLEWREFKLEFGADIDNSVMERLLRCIGALR